MLASHRASRRTAAIAVAVASYPNVGGPGLHVHIMGEHPRRYAGLALVLRLRGWAHRRLRELPATACLPAIRRWLVHRLWLVRRLAPWEPLVPEQIRATGCEIPLAWRGAASQRQVRAARVAWRRSE